MVDKINANLNAMTNGLQSRYQTVNYANMVGLDQDTGLGSELMNYGGNASGSCGLDTLSLGGMGMGMPMMGMGMPMVGGMYGGGNGQQYKNYIKQYTDAQKQMYMGNAQMQTDLEDYQMDRNVQRSHKLEGNQFNLEASNNVVDESLQRLNNQIETNNQDYVQGDHRSAVQALKAKLIETKQVPANVSDEQVSAYLNTLYEQKYHKAIGNALDENGDSQFVYGLKQGLDPFGLCVNQKSARQNMSDLLGYKLSTQDKAEEGTGKVLGYIGAGAAAIGLTFLLPFAIKGGCSGSGKLGKTWLGAWGKLFGIGCKAAEKA